jgi:hypothetical protein
VGRGEQSFDVGEPEPARAARDGLDYRENTFLNPAVESVATDPEGLPGFVKGKCTFHKIASCTTVQPPSSVLTPILAPSCTVLYHDTREHRETIGVDARRPAA